MMAYDTLFLDRDGVLNRKIDNGYVLEPGDIEILPGVYEFLAWASHVFKQIVVVTNQRCVGRGMLTHESLRKINNEINLQLGEFISGFFVCPHLDEEQCSCRKPQNGLFLRAAECYKVDFENSWMVGDSETDLIPAKSLGIKTIYISAGESKNADFTLTSPAGLLPLFLKGEALIFSEIVARTVPVHVTSR